MYAAAYETAHGFGSVGFIAGFDGKSIRLLDPILGSVATPPERCFAVTFTESGYTLPCVEPALSPSVVTPWLQEVALAANRSPAPVLTGRETGEQFVSGYPLAWTYIQRWREQIAPDWRTIALIAIFSRSTIQRPIEEAEKLYRMFGPTLRDALLAGRTPTKKQMLRYRGIKGTRAEREAPGLDDVASFVSILEWAPWVAENMLASDNFGRTFRDMVAREWLPFGLGIAKVSFTMSLSGRDASCMDTRMLQYFYGDDRAARTRFESTVSSRAKAKGSKGLTRAAVETYSDLEARLTETPYFDPDWPMPYAKAQWVLWETLGRTAGTADHSALWEVVGGTQEQPRLALVKNPEEPEIMRAARLLSMLSPEETYEILSQDMSDEDAHLAIRAAEIYLRDQDDAG